LVSKMEELGMSYTAAQSRISRALGVGKIVSDRGVLSLP